MAKMAVLKGLGVRSGTQSSSEVSLTVKDILVGEIHIKENVRKDYNNIEEIAGSIRQHGLLQPITVYADNEGYVIKTGHRRFLAYKMLYETEPDRFHSIRCIVSSAENIAVIQLVENIQRENLSQIDLYNALSSLREQGMTLKSIAEIMGKSEGYIKNLFVGINEISTDDSLKECLDSHAGVTIQDIVETKGIKDDRVRFDILEQRKDGKLKRNEFRKKIREAKSAPGTSSQSAKEPPVEKSAYTFMLTRFQMKS
jgi:ParB family chromosome partitioning protein